MKTYIKKNKCLFTYLQKTWAIGPLIALLFCACEKDLEVGLPTSQLIGVAVFENAATARAAVAELYAQLRDVSAVSGGTGGLGVAMGLYADELDYYGAPLGPLEHLYNHTVQPTNTQVQSYWNTSYQVIYGSNAVLEGLEKATSLPEAEKEPLRGEALFLRGYLHFYLLNLFGDIPFVNTTDYKVNAHVSRMSKEEVYTNIINDFAESRTLLPEEDFTGENIFADRGAATALLARIYLYNDQWQEAADACSLILESGSYSLGDIGTTFLKDSPSTIWQLKPTEGSNALEGQVYIFESGPPPFVALTSELFDDFENGDLRREAWIGEVTDGSNSWYYPYKYKQNGYTGTSQEYSILIRLAEIYLIRAEALAKLGMINPAKQDINSVRQRAGLMDISPNSPEELLVAIAKERRHEFFTEQGIRWFDLVRAQKASEVLSPLKPAWRPTDVLLPIPQSEILINPNLEPQNPGY